MVTARKHRRPSGSQQPPSSPSPPPTPSPPPPSQATSDNSATLIAECAKAKAYCSEDPKKAVQMMQDIVCRHRNIPFAHYHESHVHFTISDKWRDSTKKQSSLKNAIESARRAAKLAPNSVKYAYHLALSLYVFTEKFSLSSVGVHLHEALEECKRGLLIKDPQDPELDETHKQSQLEEQGKDQRVEAMKQEIRNLKTQVENILTMSEIEKVLAQNNLSLPVGANNVKRDEIQFKKGTRFEGRRRKLPASNFDKLLAGVDEVTKVKEYWGKMNVEQKIGLLKVNVNELKLYLGSCKDKSLKEFVTEAIDYAKKEKIWNYWLCIHCEERFVSDKLWMDHMIRREHIRNLEPRLQEMVPSIVTASFTDEIENGVWKPEHKANLIKPLEERAKLQSNADEGNVLDSGFSDRLGHDKQAKKDNPTISDEKHKGTASDDIERKELIESIHKNLQLLVRRKCFSMTHVEKLIKIIVRDLQNDLAETQIKDSCLDQRLCIISFLEVPQLHEIHKYLEALARTCSPQEKGTIDFEVDELRIKERISCSSDFSCMFLDKRVLQKEHHVDDALSCTSAMEDDGSAVIFSSDGQERDVRPDTDEFVSWLLAGCSEEKYLNSWKSLGEVRRILWFDVLRKLELEFQVLVNLVNEKDKKVVRMNALENTRDRFRKQCKDIEETSEHHPQASASNLLLQLQKMLGDSICDHDSGNPESDAISDILQRAELFECNENSTEVHVNLEKAVNDLDNSLSNELHILDAQILLSKAAMDENTQRLKLLSVYEYRLLLLPMLKSFIKSHLEDLMKKDAIEKCEAAQEALLTELTMDEQKGVKKAAAGNDGGKTRRKSKGKKKKKEKKIVEDTGDKLTAVNIEEKAKAESCGIGEVKKGGQAMKFESLLAALGLLSRKKMSRGDDTSKKITEGSSEDKMRKDQTVSLNKDDADPVRELKQEQKLLQDRLEYQRRFENEAKQKRLAAQTEDAV